MDPLDSFDRLVAALHRAALDYTHWPTTSALIEEACGTWGNGLVVGDDPHVYYAGFLSRGERHRDLEREYFGVYHDQDEALPRMRTLPAGQLVHIPALYTDREKRTSPTYNEMLPRLRSQNGLEARFDGPDGLRIVWGLCDPMAAGGWQSAQLELIERLLPHIRHFVLVRQALAAADALGASLSGLLGNSRIGVLHLDRSGRLLAANTPALDVLRRGDGLFDKDGTLQAWLPADQERLQGLLGRALPAPLGEPPSGGAMTVRRRSGGTALGLHVSPVGDAEADFGGRWVAALVLLVDPASRSRIDPARVAQALGLTPAEGRVAALLAEGRPVREIAAATGNQASTVRLFLKHIYKKQGVSGQVALVRRVLAVDALPKD